MMTTQETVHFLFILIERCHHASVSSLSPDKEDIDIVDFNEIIAPFSSSYCKLSERRC